MTHTDSIVCLNKKNNNPKNALQIRLMHDVEAVRLCVVIDAHRHTCANGAARVTVANAGAATSRER